MTKLLWTQRSDFGASRRYAGAASYDSNRSRTVVFGGYSNTNSALGDTWEWDGSLWTQMQDIGPSARAYSSMVFDSTRQVSVLFGGVSGVALSIPLGDTWQWDGANWTQLSASGPTPRSNHAMAYDSNRKRVVLFGGSPADAGLIAGGVALSDTWEFDGVDWIQQEDTGPAGRYGHSMAFDSANNRVVLFGGSNNAPAGSFQDTWAWDGNEWAQIAEFGPSVRSYASMASAGGSNMILFGGTDSASAPLADTWEFDGKLWTQWQDIGPGPLSQAQAAFDTARGRVVLFGGLLPTVAGGPIASGSTWECPVPPSTPAPPAGGGVSVASLTSSAAGVVNLMGIPITVIATLSGPAPVGGVVVNFSGPAGTGNNGSNSTWTPVTVAAGGLTATTTANVGQQQIDTQLIITAQIAGTPPVTTTVVTGP